MLISELIRRIDPLGNRRQFPFRPRHRQVAMGIRLKSALNDLGNDMASDRTQRDSLSFKFRSLRR